MSDDERLLAVREAIEHFWGALGSTSRLPSVRLTGDTRGLPSTYAVGTFAAAAVGVASAAVAELASARAGDSPCAFEVDATHAAVAFRSERYVSPIGWEMPPIWDPIAGDYRVTDGWVRVHTNYAHHRDAALRALGASATRESVASAIARRSGEDVEQAVVREGGAAAMLRTSSVWSAHAQGRAVASEDLFLSASTPFEEGRRRVEGVSLGAPPLGGIRVLDLTRVIAGPVCTRVLAAYGADVLRLDPPGFEEVGALLPDTTPGKRRAWLDLRSGEGRATFLRLIAGADLLVCGYRSSALERLDLGIDRLRVENPALGVLLLDAYGWSGPWSGRRGFDSLVQMSTGIASPVAARADGPTPLPAQALDHGAGYLVAAAACRALTERRRNSVATTVRVSLARVARCLTDLGRDEGGASFDLRPEIYQEKAESSFGPLLRVRCPGRLEHFTPRWTIPAGPLGVHRAQWRD